MDEGFTRGRAGVRLLGALAGIALAGVAAWYVLQPIEDARIGNIAEHAEIAENGEARVQAGTQGQPDASAGEPERLPSRLRFASEQPESDLSERWDDLSSAERIEIQRELFDRALADARGGIDIRKNLAQASDALSLLRPELYATTRGRALHQKLERQRDALADRTRPKDRGLHDDD